MPLFNLENLFRLAQAPLQQQMAQGASRPSGDTGVHWKPSEAMLQAKQGEQDQELQLRRTQLAQQGTQQQQSQKFDLARLARDTYNDEYTRTKDALAAQREDRRHQEDMGFKFANLQAQIEGQAENRAARAEEGEANRTLRTTMMQEGADLRRELAAGRGGDKQQGMANQNYQNAVNAGNNLLVRLMTMKDPAPPKAPRISASQEEKDQYQTELLKWQLDLREYEKDKGLIRDKMNKAYTAADQFLLQGNPQQSITPRFPGEDPRFQGEPEYQYK